MPPRNPELPEGTDHIINGAMSTGGGGGDEAPAILGEEAATGQGDTAAEAASTFVAAGTGDDTGGNATGSSGGGGSGGGGSGGGGSGGTIVSQLKGEAGNLRGQATDKVREFAESGKDRLTEALDDAARMIDDAASQIEEKLGGDYGGYARRAATAVSEFSGSLREKEVDEIYDGAREAVRKSPGVAIAAAAVLGFALVRLVKAGMPENEGSGGGGSGGGKTSA
jgi:hypothetical protein